MLGGAWRRSSSSACHGLSTCRLHGAGPLLPALGMSRLITDHLKDRSERGRQHGSRGAAGGAGGAGGWWAGGGARQRGSWRPRCDWSAISCNHHVPSTGMPSVNGQITSAGPLPASLIWTHRPSPPGFLRQHRIDTCSPHLKQPHTCPGCWPKHQSASPRTLTSPAWPSTRVTWGRAVSGASAACKPPPMLVHSDQ